jgi:hypothetical protein
VPGGFAIKFTRDWVSDLVWDLTPGDLRVRMERHLKELGVAQDPIDRFLRQKNFTHTFMAGSVAILATPIARVRVAGTVLGETADGTLVVPAAVDYVSWTERVANFAERPDITGAKARRLWLAGKVSPRTRQETIYVERGVRQQAARRAGRGLAANLSLHGYGFAHFAATELQADVRTITSVLSDPNVRSAYGARSMWEVVDKVSSLELGGSRNIQRYRTMADSDSTVISWLARKAPELAKDSPRPIVGTRPDDRRLIEACERWAVARAQPDDDR